MTRLGHAEHILQLVPAVLDREVALGRAMPPAPNAEYMRPHQTPDRPDWWDELSVPMRELAEAAIAAGIWERPR